MKPTVLNTTPIYEGKVCTVGSLKNSSILKSIGETTFWLHNTLIYRSSFSFLVWVWPLDTGSCLCSWLILVAVPRVFHIVAFLWTLPYVRLLANMQTDLINFVEYYRDFRESSHSISKWKLSNIKSYKNT